jgi:hypothetical protein
MLPQSENEHGQNVCHISHFGHLHADINETQIKSLENDVYKYPLVFCYIAIENGHGHS